MAPDDREDPMTDVPTETPQRSSRDPEELRPRLVAWLERVLPPGAGQPPPILCVLGGPCKRPMRPDRLERAGVWDRMLARVSCPPPRSDRKIPVEGNN